jgi:hypothetical protein
MSNSNNNEKGKGEREEYLDAHHNIESLVIGRAKAKKSDISA